MSVRTPVGLSAGLLLLAAHSFALSLSFSASKSKLAPATLSNSVFSFPCHRRSAAPPGVHTPQGGSRVTYPHTRSLRSSCLPFILKQNRCISKSSYSLMEHKGPSATQSAPPATAAGSASSLSTPKMSVSLSPGDGYDGEGLHFFPPSPRASLIFLHGLGDTAAGWGELLQLLEAANLHTKTRLILPTADIRHVTLNMGMRMTAWSDIRGLTPDAVEDKEGLLLSKQRIDEIIEGEIRKGIKSENIVIGGFSQGGAVAYLVGLTCKHRLGGLVVLSAWCPLGKEILVEKHYINDVPRILHCHGAADDIVRAVYGQTSLESVRNRLIDLGAKPELCNNNINFKLYNKLAHSANQEELNDVKNFLVNLLGNV